MFLFTYIRCTGLKGAPNKTKAHFVFYLYFIQKKRSNKITYYVTQWPDKFIAEHHSLFTKQSL